MASYTMQLKTYIEMFTQYESDISTREKIEKGRTKLFDFEYPIFDENYKSTFETHFIRRFYTREIGFETEGLFKFHLETWLNENMGYFNKLFESELYKFDPLENMNLTTKHKKDNDRDGSSKAVASNKANSVGSSGNFERDINSNTPDGRLQLTAKDGVGVIEYASTIDERKQMSDQKGQSESSGASEDFTVTKEKEEYIETIIGNHGVKSSSELIKEFRTSFLRVENDLFKEMQQLFMLVY